mmetsp:Transcript_30262/g.46466  ORF Transcript_30262/g.46466 Transcript_30262/m.46466 type:complete len:118 (+) Transcript_30262:173-526(+)
MSHIPKRKSGDDDDKLVVDLSAIPPQREDNNNNRNNNSSSSQQTADQEANPLAGLMPLPPDDSGGTSKLEDPLAGLVSPPPDDAVPSEQAATADSLTGMLPEQASGSGSDEGKTAAS